MALTLCERSVQEALCRRVFSPRCLGDFTSGEALAGSPPTRNLPPGVKDAGVGDGRECPLQRWLFAAWSVAALEARLLRLEM
jgi:hypothetical protein